MKKVQIRQACRARRNALSAIERSRFSAQICQRAKAYLEAKYWITGREIAGYMPILSEVDPTLLLSELHAAGAFLSLPAILSREEIIFRRFKPGQKLIGTGFGWAGPPPTQPMVSPDIVLMPLVGFDRAGGRLGYGKGHYDRLLSRFEHEGHSPCTIGLGFSCQESKSIPAELHDRPLNAIITEKGVLEVKPSSL